MENATNIVFVEQKGKNYLFTVPQGISLKKGDRVLCDTMRGEKEGVCRTNSFEVDKNSLRQIVDISGAYFPLKAVIGKSKMVKFEDEHKEKIVIYDGNDNIVKTLNLFRNL